MSLLPTIAISKSVILFGYKNYREVIFAVILNGIGRNVMPFKALYCCNFSIYPTWGKLGSPSPSSKLSLNAANSNSVRSVSSSPSESAYEILSAPPLLGGSLLVGLRDLEDNCAPPPAVEPVIFPTSS